MCEADFFLQTLPLLRESPDIALVRPGAPPEAQAACMHRACVRVSGRTRQRCGAPARSARLLGRPARRQRPGLAAWARGGLAARGRGERSGAPKRRC